MKLALVDFLNAISWNVIIAAAGPLIAVYLTNRFNMAHFRQQLEHDQRSRHEGILRERTEELYVQLQKYSTTLQTMNLPFIHVMEGKLDYNQALDVMKKEGKFVADFHRIQMLIGIYFPQLREAFAKLLNLRNEANIIRQAHKAAYLRGESGEPFIELFLGSLAAIEDACNKLVSDIVADAQAALSLRVGKTGQSASATSIK
jgi:hypothetical protein